MNGRKIGMLTTLNQSSNALRIAILAIFNQHKNNVSITELPANHALLSLELCRSWNGSYNASFTSNLHCKKNLVQSNRQSNYYTTSTSLEDVVKELQGLKNNPFVPIWIFENCFPHNLVSHSILLS